MDLISLLNISEIDRIRLIPRGPYCYSHTGKMRTVDKAFGHNGELVDIDPCEIPEIESCVFLESREGMPDQMNGYCSFLQAGDWEEDGTSLLYDAVKECGIKEEYLNGDHRYCVF